MLELPAMWHVDSVTLSEGRILKHRVLRAQQSVSYAEVLTLWREDKAFRNFFVSLLADSPHPAFRWETPPITSATADRDFEFVLLRSDALDRPVDATAFSRRFDSAMGDEVLTFPNLGGDAVMVVPCPVGPETVYGHLAAFTRGAPVSQIHELWQAVALAMQQRLGDKPVWLSTAGMGISWLHVRLDDRPKYYGYAPYKDFG